MNVTIYTDGAARGNPGPGYGAVLEYIDPKNQLHVKELSAGYRRTTNNRMELGVITALEALNRLQCDPLLGFQVCGGCFNQHWVDGWVEKGMEAGKTSR